MKTLILLSSKYGTTEKCGSLLREKLKGEVELVNIKKGNIPELDQFDRVIIGSSVYVGKISKNISEFLLANLNTLKTKEIALFICCMAEGEEGEKEINSVYPEELLAVAIAKGCFGGEFVFSKMNFFEKLIIKKISKKDGKEDISNISEEKINKFAEKLNNAE